MRKAIKKTSGSEALGREMYFLELESCVNQTITKFYKILLKG